MLCLRLPDAKELPRSSLSVAQPRLCCSYAGVAAKIVYTNFLKNEHEHASKHGQHLQLVWVKRELYHKKSCKFQHELSCHVYLVPLGMVAAGKLVGRPTAKTESSNTLNLETARYINSNCLMPIKATCCAQMEANLNSKASTSICWRCNLLGPHFSNRRAQSRTSSRRTRPTMDACPLNAFCPGQIKCRSVHL